MFVNVPPDLLEIANQLVDCDESSEATRQPEGQSSHIRPLLALLDEGLDPIPVNYSGFGKHLHRGERPMRDGLFV
jgi:hypothetical protein